MARAQAMGRSHGSTNFEVHSTQMIPDGALGAQVSHAPRSPQAVRPAPQPGHFGEVTYLKLLRVW